VSTHWPWVTLALLGAFHGANPGMGWLFAVALGLQERSGRAVLTALPPIALGHAVSVGATVAALALGQVVLSTTQLKWGIGAALMSFGVYKLVRPRHPRWVGMRVGFRDLTLWSFLMATAHGAGLMVIPVFLLASATDHAPHVHAVATPSLATWGSYALGVSLHTAAMLLTAGAIALLVYYKVGLSILRQAWFNLDRSWAAALVVAGVLAAI
jgi:hypothetical protein